MHQPIQGRGQWLWHVVRCYFNYHAVPTNFRALMVFRDGIANRWLMELNRRSERGRSHLGTDEQAH
jgi:RNA-directed DNA polymerase